MTTETLLLIIVIVLIAGALPTWPYSNKWGYGPTGILGIVLVVLLAWILFGGRPLSSPGNDLGSDVREVGHDLKDAGRDAADAVRDATN